MAVTQDSLRMPESFGFVRDGSVAVVAVGLSRWVDLAGGVVFRRAGVHSAFGVHEVVALGARDVEDELGRLGFEVVVDGVKGAEKEATREPEK